MGPAPLHPRFAEGRLLEALRDSPVVLIHGPRQCGKTTLARMTGVPRGYACFSFDDDVTRNAATADPVGFVADLPDRVVLDEVQRVPEIFTTLKAAVDRRRAPGRFLLTGSANVLLVPRLSESLAGRMEILRLHPLAQCELEGRKPRFLGRLFDGAFKTRHYERLGSDLFDRVAKGGFPAALSRSTPRRRGIWHRDYVEALVSRDVRDLSRIASLDVLPRLLAMSAGQSAQLINVTDLAGPFQVSRQTIRDYVTLLERMFLLEELSSWHVNRLKRLIKTPKLHMGDTGLASALLGFEALSSSRDPSLLGPLLETFVYQELRREASFHEDLLRFFHFRDKDGGEVDIVIERGAQEVAGVEVKATATLRAGDFRGLRRLREAAGKRFVAGVIMYDGETCASFGDSLFAVPIRTLWEPD